MRSNKYGQTIKIMSRYALKTKCDLLFETQRNRLTEIFSAVDFIGITADIWSSKHRSYMGMTAHWVDPTTLERRNAILSCARFMFPHTNDRISQHLKEICDIYGITKKVIATTTDNAANFDKAFREFGIPIELHFVDDDVLSEFEYVNIGKVLSLHVKCASHTFSLIGVKDSAFALNDKKYFNQYTSAFKKLNQLWSCANKPKGSEKIQIILGSAIHRPVATRWNSVYDCIAKILRLDSAKLAQLMSALEIPEFSVIDLGFLHEYEKVLKPIARALDYLQSECYFALLLPMVHNTKQDLLQLKTENLKYVAPLLDAVLAGIDKRLEQCKAAIVATCSHPFFKTRWLIGETHSADNLEKIRSILNSAISSMNVKQKQKENKTAKVSTGK